MRNDYDRISTELEAGFLFVCMLLIPRVRMGPKNRESSPGIRYAIVADKSEQPTPVWSANQALNND